MAELDLIFRGANVVDGSGAPSFKADVAVAGGKIAAIGRIEGRAGREIDASQRVLSPGFIDIHTHYDPQICWDRLATPSLQHGCTTVVCGMPCVRFNQPAAGFEDRNDGCRAWATGP